MFRHIAALVFIFGCTSLAWIILGATIFQRTYSANNSLRGSVVSTWGAPQEQLPPSATYPKPITRVSETLENGRRTVSRMEDSVATPLPLEKSRVRVGLDLEHRQKGLLWYSTYRVDFGGDYVFRNSTDREQVVTLRFPFPAEQAIYDDLNLTVNGSPLTFTNDKSSVVSTLRVGAGAPTALHVSYRSQGLDTWRYRFGTEVSQVRDFELQMKTNFRKIDFPQDALSPTTKTKIPGGWDLTWRYKNLISGFRIGMVLPQRLQPGPLAGKISFFAPVSLFFFFFLMFIITTLRGIPLHPMNYFFLAAAFFSFHLLLAYLVDHVSIHVAFVICSIVSIFLVVSYLRLVVGMRFAALEAGLTQLCYLVLFSYAFFFEGYTGLAITIGSILTLFIVMQMTGRIRWSERFVRSGQ